MTKTKCFHVTRDVAHPQERLVVKRKDPRVIDAMNRALLRLEELRKVANPSAKQVAEIRQLLSHASNLQGQLADWSDEFARRINVVTSEIIVAAREWDFR